ncbi:MAG: outer membrane protein [Bryobacterales bacterium]|nr:outer membrane protein [Bryobacterales bacterium]
MTLSRALELAAANNPQLRVAAAIGEGARAAVTTARARPNPDFNYVTGRQHLLQPSAAAGGQQHFGVAQLIELPSVRQARLNVAEIGRESTDYLLAETQLALRGAVKQAFYQALRRRQEIAMAEESRRIVEDLERRIRIQVQVGEAARLELIRAETEVNAANAQLRGAQLRLTTAVAQLRALLGLPATEDITLDGTLSPALDLPAFADLRNAALATHPALARLRTEVRRARAILNNEETLRKPQPTLLSEYERQPDNHYWRVGVSIPLPLANRRQGPIAEAAAGISQATASTSAFELEITSQLERAYGEYQVASQQLRAYEDGSLREAEAALAAAETAYRLGERGILEVLDAQRVLRSIRFDYLNAQFDRQSARIELEQLRGSDFQE